MGATQSKQQLSVRAANAGFPRPNSSSNVQSSAKLLHSEYGQRVWVKSNVKPHFCPRCKSRATVRSKRRGVFELTLLGLLPVRPFRCRDCDCRFYSWLFHMHPNGSKIPVARRPNA